MIQRHTAQLSAAETKIEGLRDTAQSSESEVAELSTKLEQAQAAHEDDDGDDTAAI